MRIRKFRHKDAVELARLHRNTIKHINSRDYPEDIIRIWSGKVSAKRFRDSADKCKRWVAIQDEKLVGFVDHTLEGKFWGLYVHKDFQGKGVGTKLLTKAENSLREMGIKKVAVLASISAKQFYSNKGYRVKKKHLHQMGNKQMDSYLMEKQLRK